MIVYYSVMAVFSMITLMVFMVTYENNQKINGSFTFLVFLMALSNAGYLAIALSTNLQEAVLANRIVYLGGCFISPILLFSICTICNYKVPDWLRIALYAYSFAVYSMVLTIGYNEFYYSRIFLSKFGDSTVLGHEYGIGHNFFYVIIYGYLVANIILLVNGLRKNHAISRKSLNAMIVMETINCFLFLGGRIINPGFEIMPTMYVLDGWILLYLHHRAMLYNIEDNIISSLEKQKTYGYIVFDDHENYLGCNDVARMIFPEIAGCRVDLPIRDVPEVEVILGWIREYASGSNENISYENNGNHYQCRIEKIWHRNKVRGYIVELQEDTDRWHYTNLLSRYNEKLENEVREKTEHIVNMQSQVLLGMADMVENRDINTGGHVKRTSDVIRILMETIQINKLLPLDEEFCDAVIKAAPMHDLGKIGIDDKILK